MKRETVYSAVRRGGVQRVTQGVGREEGVGGGGGRRGKGAKQCWRGRMSGGRGVTRQKK